MKGVELEIPPEIAASLRQGPQRTGGRSRPGPASDNNDANDEWNQLIPMVSRVAEEDNIGQGSDENDESAVCDEDEADETTIKPSLQSLAKPVVTTLPLLLIDISKLQGFPSSSMDETNQIKEHLTGALDSESFLATIRDLLEVGVAKHAERECAGASGRETRTESPALADSLDQLVLDYPEWLYLDADEEQIDETTENGGATAVVRRRETRQLWNAVASPHSIPIVDRLFRHLQDCQRDLVWKYQVRTLLQGWVEHRQLVEWRTRRRREQLNQLYQVRQAFELRIQMAEQKIEKFELDRDKRVRDAIQKRRLADVMGICGSSEGGSNKRSATGGGSPLLLLWDANGDDDENRWDNGQEALVSDSSDYGDTGSCASSRFGSNSSASSVDGHAEVELALPADVATATTVPESMDTSLEKESKRRERRRAKHLLNMQERRERQEVVEHERARELESVLEALTLNDHRISLAVLESLQSKIQHVDDLIESLQEEQWQDEEETDVGGGESIVGGDQRHSSQDAGQLSMMDQILAMILSSLDTKEQEDYEKLRDEHVAIRTGWLEHFGTLPSSPNTASNEPLMTTAYVSSEEQQLTLREELGITDCVWDDDE